jgi:hypothetical protein
MFGLLKTGFGLPLSGFGLETACSKNYSLICRSPGGGSGERPPHFLLGFRLLASGFRTAELGGLEPFFSYAYGRLLVTSGLGLPVRASFTSLFVIKPATFPRGGVKKVLWDCKVTPAYCACQEGNTMGCISSNDGLGAGVLDFFPQVEFIGHSQSGSFEFSDLDPKDSYHGGHGVHGVKPEHPLLRHC